MKFTFDNGRWVEGEKPRVAFQDVAWYLVGGLLLLAVWWVCGGSAWVIQYVPLIRGF